jgi:4,5:9,10-diseco-3-hydroxy-5,9,17-trioxoandrosta-1(10),2-diene-4-oate hydrolase
MTPARIKHRLVPTDAGVVHFRDAGRGRPLVLLHGFGHSSTAWLRTIPALAKHRRVIAPDLPDYDRVNGPLGGVDPPYFASVVAQLAQTLGLGTVDIVGNSLGGLVALLTALERPGVVGKLVLANPLGFTKPPTPPLDEALLALMSFWLSLPRPRQLIRAAYEAGFFDRTRADDETVEEIVARSRKPETASIRSRTLHALFHFSRNLDRFHARLPSLQHQIMIVWGKNDSVLPVRDLEIARRVLPSPRIEVLDACGHLPQIELPDVFSSLVLDFLKA